MFAIHISSDNGENTDGEWQSKTRMERRTATNERGCAGAGRADDDDADHYTDINTTRHEKKAFSMHTAV